MVQHGSTYKVLDRLGCLSGEDFNISNNIDKLNHVREKIPISFQIGQIVFRKNHILNNMSKKINKKFMPKYIKCKIMNKIGNNLYDIVDI